MGGEWKVDPPFLEGSVECPIRIQEMMGASTEVEWMDGLPACFQVRSNRERMVV
jgi:hypothetical protein